MIELTPASISESASVTFRNIGRGKTLVLPTVDHVCKAAGRPSLVVQTFRLNELLDQTDHIVGVKYGKIRGEIYQFCMSSEQFHANRVKCSKPRHAFYCTANQMSD